jgi:hypothetical protein
MLVTLSSLHTNRVPAIMYVGLSREPPGSPSRGHVHEDPAYPLAAILKVELKRVGFGGLIKTSAVSGLFFFLIKPSSVVSGLFLFKTSAVSGLFFFFYQTILCGARSLSLSACAHSLPPCLAHIQPPPSSRSLSLSARA